MKGNTTLKGIPVVSADGAGRRHVHGRQQKWDLDWMRRMTRMGMLLALILIPVSGLFRIDLSSGFVILNHQIWFADFFIVFGFWLAAACLLILLYSSLGTVFCGWLCPQNTASTWANKATMRLLGKRAIIDWEGEEGGARLSAGKNKLRNWFFLSLRLLALAMLLALIPLLYFFPPGAMWSFVTFQEDPRLSGSLYWIYTVFVFIALANVAVVRHYACRYMCIYRMWQFLFKTRDTLHIEYDESRGEECAKCNFCVTACPVGIDPRRTLAFDSCTNCGECITACNNLHRRRGEPGLLRYRFGRRRGKAQLSNRVPLTSLLRRASWVTPVLILALSILTWGMVTYEPYHMAVYRADTEGGRLQTYQINVANKRYAPAEVRLVVTGLPEDGYTLDRSIVTFDTATRQDVSLRLSNELPPGFYTVTVMAAAGEWSKRYAFQHYVP